MGADYVTVKANSEAADFEIDTMFGENSNIKAFFWDNQDYAPKINAVTYSKN